MSQHTIDELTKKYKALEKENEILRRANQGTEKEREALQAILNNIPAPIYLKDPDGKYIFVNKKYEYLSNNTFAKIKGKTDYELFPAPVAELFRSQDEKVKKCKTPLEFEESVQLIDGEYSFITLKFPVTDIQDKLYAVGGFCTDITDRIKVEKEKESLIKDLYHALEEVTVLRGILPICASCKSIRDDEGYWSRIETYLNKHSKVEFSHGLCPTCMEELYSSEDWYQKDDDTGIDL